MSLTEKAEKLLETMCQEYARTRILDEIVDLEHLRGLALKEDRGEEAESYREATRTLLGLLKHQFGGTIGAQSMATAESKDDEWVPGVPDKEMGEDCPECGGYGLPEDGGCPVCKHRMVLYEELDTNLHPDDVEFLRKIDGRHPLG